MKVLKKLLSVFLSAAIMVSMVCTSTVCASAASSYKFYMYENSNGDLIFYIDGIDVNSLLDLKDEHPSKESFYHTMITFKNSSKTYYSLDLLYYPDSNTNFLVLADRSNPDSKLIENTDNNVFFYKSNGDSYLKQGLTFTILNNSTNKKAINQIKKATTADIYALTLNVQSEASFSSYGVPDEKDSKSVSITNLKKEAKIKKISKSEKSDSGKTSVSKDDGSPYYFAYYQKYNKTEQVALDGITEDEWNYLSTETAKGNTLTVVLKFTSGNQALILSYVWLNGTESFSSYVKSGFFTFVNGKYLFFFTLSPSISEGARNIIKSAKTCEASIHITDNKTKKITNYHNLNELFEINFIGDEESLSNSNEKKISSLSFSKVSSMTYTGKARKPAVTIKDGDYTLKKGTDYTLTYKSNKNIGTATVTVKGKGKYTGSKTIEFKIVPKKTTLKVTKKSDTKAKFSWAAVDGAEKYQIYYSTDGKKYKKLATISGKKTSATLSGLDFDKYDYKFKIRSYGTNDGKKYYSSYSKTVTVK